MEWEKSELEPMSPRALFRHQCSLPADLQSGGDGLSSRVGDIKVSYLPIHPGLQLSVSQPNSVALPVLSDLQKVRRFLSTVLPIVRTSPFFGLLFAVFVFYISVTVLSVLLIVFSIWF